MYGIVECVVILMQMKKKAHAKSNKKYNKHKICGKKKERNEKKIRRIKHSKN